MPYSGTPPSRVMKISCGIIAGAATSSLLLSSQNFTMFESIGILEIVFIVCISNAVFAFCRAIMKGVKEDMDEIKEEMEEEEDIDYENMDEDKLIEELNDRDGENERQRNRIKSLEMEKVHWKKIASVVVTQEQIASISRRAYKFIQFVETYQDDQINEIQFRMPENTYKDPPKDTEEGQDLHLKELEIDSDDFFNIKK